MVFNAEGDTEAACAELAELIALDPPPFMLELVQTADGLSCP